MDCVCDGIDVAIITDIASDDGSVAGVRRTLSREIEPHDEVAIIDKPTANCCSNTTCCTSDNSNGSPGGVIGGRGVRESHRVSFVNTTSGHEFGHEEGYEVVVDQDECVSAGKCVASAVGYFVFDADQIVEINETGTKPDDAMLLRIARACPSGAIRLLRDGVEVDI